MLIIHAICAALGAMIFAMPILYPDAEVREHNRGVK